MKLYLHMTIHEKINYKGHRAKHWKNNPLIILVNTLRLKRNLIDYWGS